MSQDCNLHISIIGLFIYLFFFFDKCMQAVLHTANRLWLISAPSTRVCLSVSVTSAARSHPAKSMNENLSQ